MDSHDMRRLKSLAARIASESSYRPEDVLRLIKIALDLGVLPAAITYDTWKDVNCIALAGALLT